LFLKTITKIDLSVLLIVNRYICPGTFVAHVVFKLFTFVKQTLCSLKLKAKDEGSGVRSRSEVEMGKCWCATKEWMSPAWMRAMDGFTVMLIYFYNALLLRYFRLSAAGRSEAHKPQTQTQSTL